MEQPANTVSYFAAGYAVIFGIMLIYLVSLIVRWRNLREEERNLVLLEKKEE
jgi:hypothetical protein